MTRYSQPLGSSGCSVATSTKIKNASAGGNELGREFCASINCLLGRRSPRGIGRQFQCQVVVDVQIH